MAWQKPELLPSWIQRLGGGTLVFGVVAVVILVFAVVMSMDSRSRQAGAAGRSRADQSRGSSAVEPVAALDTSRRGAIDLARADFSALRARYEEQLSQKPADPELLNNLGLALEHLGQVDDAIARFEGALRTDPLNFAYHFNLAHASALRRDWDRSVAEYRVAASRLPSDYAARYNLGMALYLKGDQASAIPELQKGTEMAPGVPAFHLALGACYEKLARVNEAIREYKTYLAMAPSAPDADRVRSHLQSMPGGSRS